MAVLATMLATLIRICFPFPDLEIRMKTTGPRSGEKQTDNESVKGFIDQLPYKNLRVTIASASTCGVCGSMSYGVIAVATKPHC